MTTFLQQLVNGISLGSIYALIALGYTMVYGVLRLINFAHGDVYMVGAYVGYYLSRKLKGDEPSLAGAIVVMLGAMLACGLLGVIIERFAYRPVRRAARLTLLITAIGVSLFIENAVGWEKDLSVDVTDAGLVSPQARHHGTVVESSVPELVETDDEVDRRCAALAVLATQVIEQTLDRHRELPDAALDEVPGHRSFGQNHHVRLLARGNLPEERPNPGDILGVRCFPRAKLGEADPEH